MAYIGGLGFDGSSEPPRRRRRRRSPLVLAVVAVLVLVVVGGLLVVRTAQRRTDRRNLAAATQTVDGFLAAWGRGDATTMASLATADTAAYVRSEVPMLAKSLQITSATYRHGPVGAKGNPGTDVTGDVLLQGLGTWHQASRLVLRKVDGAWQVEFTPQTVTPRLTSASSLTRTRDLGTRGRFLAADGTALKGVDGELDGNLLGTTGTLTAAQAQAAGPSFAAGDTGGIGGLQRAYNSQLGGTPGGSLTVRDAAGTVVQTLLDQPKTDGTDVRLSVDLSVQHAAEQALATLPATQIGSLVAIDTRSGDILAIGNHPYDGYGYGIRGQFPPGSTFKIVTATAALMSGETAASPLDCTATVSAGGRSFKNAENEAAGTISLETAFAKSCNTAFIRLSQQLPAGALGAAAALYGLSSAAAPQVPPPLPILSFAGSVPAPTDGADSAAEAIGQGRILVSPLQLASIAAATSTGTWRQPSVLASRPSGLASHVLPASVVSNLHAFMAAVVSSGTAAGSGLPAGTYGKTGTAEYGTATPPKTIAWFVGYRGDVAFACQVGGDAVSGGFGADTAAPLVARFLTALG